MDRKIFENLCLLTAMEREEQENKWGKQIHNGEKWLTIFSEEFGELAKEILENNAENAKKEFVQCVAVLFAMNEDFESREIW